MTQMWRINLAFVLLLIGVVLVPLFFGRVPMPFSQSDRLIGEPLDGDWYSGEESGCFDTSSVVHFRADKLYFRRVGTEIEFGSGVDSVTFEEVMKIRPNFQFPKSYGGINGLMTSIDTHSSPAGSPDVPVFVFFEDQGVALKPLSTIIDGDLTDLEHEDGALKTLWSLRRCASPTVWGVIQSLWRMDYRPNETFRPIQLKNNR